MLKNRKTTTGIAALVVAAGIATGFAIWGQAGLPDTPERSAEGKEVYYFDTVAEMTATSDLVVKAEVSEVEVGDTVGDDPEAEVTNRNIRLDVTEVLHEGDKGSAPKSLTLVEAGWDSDGVGVVVNGVQWSELGDVGYYYLHQGEEPGRYYLICSYGRLLIEDGAARASGAEPDQGPWAGSKADFTDTAAVTTVIDEAVTAAETGEVAPVEAG